MRQAIGGSFCWRWSAGILVACTAAVAFYLGGASEPPQPGRPVVEGSAPRYTQGMVGVWRVDIEWTLRALGEAGVVPGALDQEALKSWLSRELADTQLELYRPSRERARDSTWDLLHGRLDWDFDGDGSVEVRRMFRRQRGRVVAKGEWSLFAGRCTVTEWQLFGGRKYVIEPGDDSHARWRWYPPYASPSTAPTRVYLRKVWEPAPEPPEVLSWAQRLARCWREHFGFLRFVWVMLREELHRRRR